MIAFQTKNYHKGYFRKVPVNGVVEEAETPRDYAQLSGFQLTLKLQHKFDNEFRPNIIALI